MKTAPIEKTFNHGKYYLFRLILSGLVAVSLIFFVAPAHSEDTNITDADINRVIEGQLILDPAVPYDQLDISTYEGIVMYKGEVDNILIREMVQEIAASVKGVRGIVNQLTVAKSGIADADIQKAIETAWLADPAADSYELTARVKDGVVTVSGTVQSWAEQQISLTVAKGVKGVREIKDKITIEPESLRPAGEMRAEINSRLQYDVLVDDLLINVSVSGSKAVLSGKVGSLAEKNRAIRNAWVLGITQVESDALDVVWWSRQQMRRTNIAPYKDDKKIRSAVQDALLVDPRVYAFNPRVTVKNGVVYLNGVVDNFRAKKAAENDARNVTGVIRVKNLLKVRPKAIPPEKVLKKRVKYALEINPVVQSDIKVRIKNGRVYLSGEVDDWYEKYQAGRVVETVSGAVRVENLLTYPERILLKSDSELVGDIKDQLFWSPFVDADQVHVTASDGNVFLTGQVDSWMERQAAKDNAYEAGAGYVINQLTINSSRLNRQERTFMRRHRSDWRHRYFEVP